MCLSLNNKTNSCTLNLCKSLVKHVQTVQRLNTMAVFDMLEKKTHYMPEGGYYGFLFQGKDFIKRAYQSVNQLASRYKQTSKHISGRMKRYRPQLSIQRVHFYIYLLNPEAIPYCVCWIQ